MISLKFTCPDCQVDRLIPATECVVHVSGLTQYVAMTCPVCASAIEKAINDAHANQLRAGGAVAMSVEITEGEVEAFAADLAALSESCDLVGLIQRERADS